MRGDETSKELSTQAAQLVALAREELGVMSLQRRVEGLARLRARRWPSKRRVDLLLSFVAALTVAVLVFIGTLWLDLHQRGALSYAIEGGRMGHDGVVEGNGATEPTLRFSDGTEVVFSGGARGQLRSVDEHGARIALAGKAKVEVVPWQGSHWLFDVGPFLITVKGTAFTAEWIEPDERLEVELRTGTVSVSGPPADEAITLRAGQRLVISVREKEMVIRDIDPSAESGATAVRPSSEVVDSVPPAQAERLADEKPAPPRSATAPVVRARRAPASPATSNWAAELAAGHFSIILQEAEQRGIDASLAEVSSDDLAALADAARYSRREDVARRALTALRRRFAKSARANDAAFLLGRLEENAQHLELALGWYDSCLDESPNGTYTSEALGRKMTLTKRLYGARRAQPIAEEYLRRFERGAYAAAARALTRAP